MDFSAPAIIDWESKAISTLRTFVVGRKTIFAICAVQALNFSAGPSSFTIRYGRTSQTACGSITFSE
jgi:hypothetical protein